MRLYSSVIRLFNLYPVTIPPPGGQHAHAAFLDIVRQVDPAISQALHNNRGKGARQPFTISPILGLPGDLGRQAHKTRKEKQHNVAPASFSRSILKNEIHLPQGWKCWFRVTILNEDLFHRFIEYFLAPTLLSNPLPLGERTIRLGDARFAVSEILTTSGSHPWAGVATLNDLQKRLDEPAPDSILLEFHSPTSFSLGKKPSQKQERYELIPYPRLVFGSLAMAWKTLSGEDIVQAVEEYTETHLRLVLHRLERHAMTLHNRPQLGSVGKAEYEFVAPEDTPLARALSLLADIAFYTGVGRKTAQGMGMTRRVHHG